MRKKLFILSLLSFLNSFFFELRAMEASSLWCLEFSDSEDEEAEDEDSEDEEVAAAAAEEEEEENFFACAWGKASSPKHRKYLE